MGNAAGTDLSATAEASGDGDSCVVLRAETHERLSGEAELRTLAAVLAFLEREVDGRVPAFVCVFGRGSSEAFIEQARGILAGRYPRARVRRATWGSYA